MPGPADIRGVFPGTRVSPGYHPSPNGRPVGYLTGAPVYTVFKNVLVAPASGNDPTEVVPGTPENRVVLLTAPFVRGMLIRIGSSGVNARRGLALPPGLAYEAVLPGLQALYAVVDGPAYLEIQVQIGIILLAEQQREVGG